MDGADDAANGLTFELLGPLRVSRGGEVLGLGGKQQRAVLAQLAADVKTTLSVDRLADGLWGLERAASYATTIQTYVFHLRRAMEPDRPRGAPGQLLATVPGGYQLDVPEDAVDAKVFARLARDGAALIRQGDAENANLVLSRALALWRGDPFADLDGFPFVPAVGRPLEELRITVAEHRIDADLALGAHVAVLTELDGLIARNPLRERFHEQRMLALYRSGRQSDALSAFRELRAILDEALGIEPSPPLQRLQGAILTQDPELDRFALPGPFAVARDSSPENRGSVRDVIRKPEITVGLLGDQHIRIDGVHVAAVSVRAIALLAYLVLHADSPQPRQHLSGLFWPDSTDGQARTDLRRELHMLRSAVPTINRWLLTDARTLMWRSGPGCLVDVTKFDSLASAAEEARRAGDHEAFRARAIEAVETYRGDLAPGLSDDWVTAERDALRRRCVTLLDQVAEGFIAEGAPADAIVHLRRRIDLEPSEEVGYRSLLRAQGMAGDRAAAAHTFHRCVAMLERELRVEPGRRTIEEYERVVAQDSGDWKATLGASTPNLPSRRASLVGRDVELGVLARCWQRALEGEAGFAIVTGEAGVGKSRLLDELFVRVRRDGAVVARSRCFAASGRLPLAPVAEWLRSPALQSARERLDEVWRREVERLVPAQTAAVSRREETSGEWQRHRFFEGLARAILVTDAPTLLLLDDLQWCDEDTVAWLQLLLGLAQNASLLVIGSARSEELADNSRVADCLRALASAGLSTDIALEPLSSEETASLARELLGPGAVVDAQGLHRATGGFPLFVTESVQSQLATGSSGNAPRAQAILDGRIAQVGDGARAIVGIAAAIGRDFDLELLARSADLDGSVVLDAVDELWRRRILREVSGDTYDFVHDLLRDAAYSALSPPRRKHAHARVAAALQSLVGEDPAAAADIAEQHEKAGEFAQAIPYHVLAAEAARAMFANDDSLAHYRRALELLETRTAAGPERDRTELAIRHAMVAPLVARQGYASEEVHRAVTRWITLAEMLGDSRRATQGLIGLFGVRYVAGHVRESYEIGLQGLRMAEQHPEFAAQAHLSVGGGASGCGRHQEAVDHFALSVELAGDEEQHFTGARVGVFALAWSGQSRYLLDRPTDAANAASKAVDLASAGDSHYSLTVALAHSAITNQLLGDTAQMIDYAERLEAHSARFSIAYYLEWGAILRGWAAGGLDGAHAIEAALARLRKLGALGRMPYYQGLLAETLIAAGELDHAGAILDAARAQAGMYGDTWYLPELWRFEARRHSGDRSRSCLTTAIQIADAQPSPVFRRRAIADLDELGAGANSLRTP